MWGPLKKDNNIIVEGNKEKGNIGKKSRVDRILVG